MGDNDSDESIEDKFIRITLDLTIIGLFIFVYILWVVYYGSLGGARSLSLAGVVAILSLGYLLVRWT